MECTKQMSSSDTRGATAGCTRISFGAGPSICQVGKLEFEAHIPPRTRGALAAPDAQHMKPPAITSSTVLIA